MNLHQLSELFDVLIKGAVFGGLLIAIGMLLGWALDFLRK